jgi:hypothetical protein
MRTPEQHLWILWADELELARPAPAWQSGPGGVIFSFEPARTPWTPGTARTFAQLVLRPRAEPSPAAIGGTVRDRDCLDL